MGNSIQLFYVLLIVKIPPIQVVPPIKSAMIRILKQPHFECAFARVELCHRAVNFEEDVLGNVFGLSPVPDDFERDAEDETMVALKQDGKSVVDAGLELDH